MNRTLSLIVVGFAVLGYPSAASAVVVYSTGFEDAPFANHSQLVGQDGWVGFSVPGLFNLSPNAAEIATGIHAEGHQAVHVRGKDLERQDFLNDLTGGYYDAIGSYRRAVNYETSGTQTVRVSADVYVQGGQKTPDGTNFFSASVSTRTGLTDGGTAGTGELAISSDGHVYGYSGNEHVPAFLTSAPVTLNAWHNLAVDVNPGARNYTFLLDGASLGTFDFQMPPDTEDPTIDYTNVLTRGSILAYAAPDTESLKKQNFAAHFDNFSIVASPSAASASIPEPATALLLVLCGVLAVVTHRGALRRR
jgi:hypothetical protein